MEEPQNLCKKKEEQQWKEEEKWRTIERKKKKEFDPKAFTTSTIKHIQLQTQSNTFNYNHNQTHSTINNQLQTNLINLTIHNKFYSYKIKFKQN